MKTAIPGIITLWLIVSLSAWSSDAKVLLKESFEQVNPGTWRSYSDQPRLKVSMTPWRERPHSGVQCVRVKNAPLAEGKLIHDFKMLPPGEYYLEFYARTEPGKAGILQGWLGDGYTDWIFVDEEWTKIAANVTVTSGQALELWARFVRGAFDIDDVLVERGFRELDAPAASSGIPFGAAPVLQKTLIYQPSNLMEFGENAQWYADNGIAGGFFLYIMEDHQVDIWATDGEPVTRTPETDALLMEAQFCNEMCRAAGVDSNFIAISFSGKLPDFLDAAVVANSVEKFRQAAIFGRAAGFKGIALDFEYVGSQYAWNAVPAEYERYLAQARSYGNQVANVMFREFPEMELLLVWENVVFAGPVGAELISGIMDAAARNNAPGGVHVMCESTYLTTNGAQIMDKMGKVRKFYTQLATAPETRKYVAEKLDFAVGMWPVSTSYADNLENYSPEAFQEAVAAARKTGGKYNWIYVMPNSFSRQDAESAAYFRTRTRHRYWPENSTDVIPAPPERLDEYLAVLRSDVILE